jgi:hypothetical protein
MREREESVELRAFRGTRKASVYREYRVSETAFGRVLSVGAERGLSLVSSLDPHGRRELDKAEAKRLADETTAMRMSGQLPDLDDDLTAIAELARWCIHATEDSWLTIVGP